MGTNITDQEQEQHEMKLENLTQAGPTESYNLKHSSFKLQKKVIKGFNR